MLKGQAMQELTLRRTVELAVDTEQRGQCVYNGLADKFSDDAEMSAIFARLAKDEQMHEAQFKQILETIPEGDEPVQIDADSETYIRATALSMFLKYEVFNNLDDIEGIQDALINALDFEKASKVYYEAMAELHGDSPQLDAIIKAEREHINALMRVILTDAKFRGLAEMWP